MAIAREAGIGPEEAITVGQQIKATMRERPRRNQGAVYIVDRQQRGVATWPRACLLVGTLLRFGEVWVSCCRAPPCAHDIYFRRSPYCPTYFSGVCRPMFAQRWALRWYVFVEASIYFRLSPARGQPFGRYAPRFCPMICILRLRRLILFGRLATLMVA